MTLGGGSPRGQLSRHTAPRPFRLQQHGGGDPAPSVRRRTLSPGRGRVYHDAHVWGVFTRLGLAVREGADQTRGAPGAMEEERLSQVL